MKTKTKELFQYLIGALIVAGTFVLIAMLIVTVIKHPESPLKDVLVLSVGTLLAAFGSVVGYFYGSSKGSADKGDIINQNQKKPNDQ